jgi:DNA-binding response OmpR family regulator
MMAHTILVVDDDKATNQLVANILTREGYAVETAANGLEGLLVLDRVQPTLVILDIAMPLMDGNTFAQRLAKRRTRPPILIMTALDDAQAIATSLGAEGYLSKPFHYPDLLNAVRTIVNKAEPRPRTQWE